MKYYSHTNREIIIGHFPGDTKRIEANLINELSNRSFSKPDNIGIVCPYTDNTRELSILIDQLERNNCSYYDSLKDKIIKWEPEKKAFYVLESLKEVKEEYSLILDTNDVVILTDLADILDRFNEYKEEFPKLEALYNATIWMYPHIIIDDVPNRYKYGDFCYLNGGCCIGRTEYLKEFYEEICKDIQHSFNINSNVFSEQYYIRKIFDKHQDKVFFDYKCSIFQCWHKQEYRYDGDKCYLL